MAPKAPTPKLRPTRLGLAFLGLMMLTLVGCVNYGLSLGYGLTFALGGVWIITAAQALRAIRGLSVTLQAPAEAVAGQNAPFTAQFSPTGQKSNVRLRMQVVQSGSVRRFHISGRLPANQPLILHCPVPRLLRGPLSLEKSEVIAVDLLGLWEASLPSNASAEVLVLPRPEINPPPAPTTLSSSDAKSTKRIPGQDDFAGLRPYQPGDSPRLISWRHAARTGQLLTREFDAPAAQALYLDWAATNGDTEARLSRLAAWVAQARRGNQPFGLTLPGYTLPVASGESQARAALNALGLYSPLPEPAPKPPSHNQSEPPFVLPKRALRFSLLALGFALLPGLSHWPLWAFALCVSLLVYSAMQANPKRRLPPLSPLALAALALATAWGLLSQLGTLLGLDAGTAILAVLLCLKAAETRTIRDAKLLPLLGLFLLITHFFHDQGPLTALHNVLALVLLLSALARWVNVHTWAEAVAERPKVNQPTEIPPTGIQPQTASSVPARGEITRQATTLLLLSAPLAIALFFLFPRPNGPLWRLPLQSSNQTGLADEIQAGSFSNLAQSNAVAFRADFQGPLPPANERYWRGPVFETFDGQKWSQMRYRFQPATVEPVGGATTYNYTLTLEPNGKNWLLALDTPTQDSLPRNTYLSSAFQAFTMRPATMRTRYTLQSVAARLGREESPERLNYDLQLPPGQNPRALALAQSWRNLPPEKRVAEALNYIASGGFGYTLNPPLLAEQNRIDDFLFHSKQGFCEHYSSAFAFLMRAAGIPARIVGGYQGGQVGLDGQYLTVRQQDAHAWNEVWLEGRGWLRVDPTAAAAPARINANLGTALSQPQATSARPPNNLERLRLQLDAFQNNWNTWVSAYDGEQQRSTLARLGIKNVGSGPYLLALAALVALLLLPAFAFIRCAARPKDPVQAALYDLGNTLNLPQHSGETASSYAKRAGQLYPQQKELLSEIADLYNQLRYRSGDPSQSSQELKRLREKVRQVRKKE